MLAHAYAGEIDAAREVAAGLLAEVGDTLSPFGAFAWYCAGEAELGRDDDQARALLGRAIDVAERTDTSFVVGIAGASLASLEARQGEVTKATVEAYRRLLDHWYRAGVWATQWPMLRSVATLLHRMGRDRDAAVLVAAVRHTWPDTACTAPTPSPWPSSTTSCTAGSAVRARRRRAEGLVLDGDAAVEHALRSLG